MQNQIPLWQPPAPVARINRRVIGLGLAVLIGVGAWLLSGTSKQVQPKETQAPQMAQAITKPEEVTKLPQSHGDLPKPQPPTPSYPSEPPAQIPVAQPVQVPAEPPHQGSQPLMSPATKPPEKPAKKPWDFLAKPRQKEGRDQALDAKKEEAITQALQQQREAQDLIHNARWAMPALPLVTIYRSQTLTGRLLQSVNSDLPGQVKIQLTTPVLDRFGYDTTILPKDTMVIASQEGKAQYGTARLALKLEQLELPTGEVVSLKAMVGDEEGANGVGGKTNNHYGKLLLATGISAVLNVGARTATGTPTGFYQDPAQEAARDVGYAVRRDAQGIVDRELRIPPTITIPAGTFCTINLGENIQFAHRPTIVR